MVGVAGKSKGCNTCRQRKCDEAGIPCGPCSKSRKVCTGYLRDRLFKNLSALDHDSLLSRSQPLITNTEASILRYEWTGSVRGDFITAHGSQQGASGNIPTDRVFGCFMAEYMPLRPGTGLQDGKTPLSWMQVIPQMNQGHPSLGNALAALSMVRLGRKFDDKKLRGRGLASYGLALEGMQEALRSEAAYEQTLASCLTMAIFELLEVPGHDARGWISHIRGLSKLFQIRGPNKCASGPSHYLFLGFRVTEIIYALAIRRSTYLAGQPWISAPWANIPKSDFHYLLDLMAGIAALMERGDALRRSYISPSAQKSILKQGSALEGNLRRWYAECQTRSELPLFTKRGSYQTQWVLGLEIPLDEVVEFEDFEYARMHMLYWAALLLIYTNIRMFDWSVPIDPCTEPWSSKLPPTDDDIGCSPAVQLAHVDLKILEAGMLILGSVPYLLSEDAHILGPQNVFFPLRVAQHAFSVLLGRDREVQSCKDVFSELLKRGFPFGQLLSETEWDCIPGLLSGHQ